ncbi:hypothetical protein [Paraburkholderia hospita]|nr:hypothetical protein [Paraburkholderia hospita]
MLSIYEEFKRFIAEAVDHPATVDHVTHRRADGETDKAETTPAN